MLCSIIIHVAIEHSSLMRCQEVKNAGESVGDVFLAY